MAVLNTWNEYMQPIGASGGIRDPGNVPTQQPQQRSQGGGMAGFNWDGFNRFRESETRRNTAPGVAATFDAFSGVGDALNRSTNSVGAGAAANANRIAQSRDVMMNASRSANPVPYSMDAPGFNSWMAQNNAYRNNNLAQQKAATMQQLELSPLVAEQQRIQRNQDYLDKMRYALPYQQQLMSSMFGGGGGGNYTTNFGAAGSF